MVVVDAVWSSARAASPNRLPGSLSAAVTLRHLLECPHQSPSSHLDYLRVPSADGCGGRGRRSGNIGRSTTKARGAPIPPASSTPTTKTTHRRQTYRQGKPLRKDRSSNRPGSAWSQHFRSASTTAGSEPASQPSRQGIDPSRMHRLTQRQDDLVARQSPTTAHGCTYDYGRRLSGATNSRPGEIRAQGAPACAHGSSSETT